jgi:uncharacterized protein YkwD
MTKRQFFLTLIYFLLIFFSVTNEQLIVFYSKVIDYLDLKTSQDKNLELLESHFEGRVNNSGILKKDRTGDLKEDALSINQIVKYSNEYRQNNKLPLLLENSNLILSAEKKAQDILDNQYFEHISPGGVGVGDLGVEVKYDYILIGENLAMGNFKDSRELVDAWMESPGHRANILNSNYTETGVAVKKGFFDGKEVWVAVVHFGTPKSVCQEADKGIREEIDLAKNKIDQMKTELSSLSEKIEDGEAGYDRQEKNDLISLYNKKVSDYNLLLTETGEKINKYNKQITLFNNCLESKL